MLLEEGYEEITVITGNLQRIRRIEFAMPPISGIYKLTVKWKIEEVEVKK